MKEPHHIVSIGASAGGTEEIEAFFDQKLPGGIAYIVVQHLSSDFKTRMVELLAHHTDLLVHEAEDGMSRGCRPGVYHSQRQNHDHSTREIISCR